MREFICINCPLGCQLKVDDSDLSNIKVTGNTCKRGERYGIDEVLNPKRMVTSSVIVLNGKESVVSVKTKEAIPKGLIFDSLELLKNTKVEAPVKIGDVIIKNVLDTGVDFVATRNVERN
jgi:CxxC motif-containing protein